MASLALDAASYLIPKAIDAFMPPSSPAPPPPTDSVDEPLSRSDRTILSTQTLPPTPPLPLGPSPSPSRHTPRMTTGVIIPFQTVVASFTGGISESYTKTLPSFPVVSTIIKPYRDVVLLELEAVVYPSAESYKHPLTIDIAWTPADVTVTGSTILSTPGSARITCGGLNLLNQGVVLCDLTHINSILKSPIPYTNAPRLNYLPHKSNDVPATATTDTATLVVRGRLHCMHPLAIPL